MSAQSRTGGDHSKAHTALIDAIQAAVGRIPGVDFEELHQTRPSQDDRGNWIPAGGMRPGAADLIGLVAGVRVDLEVKTGGATQTDEQKQWQRRIRLNGGVCEVVRSVDDALRVVRRILDEHPDAAERIAGAKREMKAAREESSK